jgi:hypothetical protein
MTSASRFGGKIQFIMPDNWTQDQVDKLADNVLEQVAPKVAKLKKKKKGSRVVGKDSFVNDEDTVRGES